MYRRNAQEWSKHLDFIFIELASQQLAYIFACLLRQGIFPYSDPRYRNMGIVIGLLDCIVLMFLNTMHDVLKRGFYVELVQTIRHCVVVLALATTYLFALQYGESYSRLILFITCALHILIGFLIRVSWKKFLRAYGNPVRNKASMLVVLNSESCDYMMGRLQQNPAGSYDFVGVVLDKGSRTDVKGVPVVCSLEEASKYICQKWIDAVYIDVSATDPRITKLMDDCYTMAVPVNYHVPGISRDGVKQFVERIGGSTVLTTSINYATPVQLFMKRCLDIAGGIVGSLLALIIMAIVGPIIKKHSPGRYLSR